MADMFWGTIKVAGKTLAIVGPEGSIEKAKAAYGIVSAVSAGASSAPLQLASLDAPKEEPKAPPAANPGSKDVKKDSEDDDRVDVSPESLKAARGPRALPTGEASRWAMVRAPKKP